MGPDVEKTSDLSRLFSFLQDLLDVIHRTRQAGVKTLVAITEGMEEFSRVLHLQERYPDVVGLHPLQAAGGQRSVQPPDLEEALPLFYNLRERLVAVGEQDRDDQMKVFIGQLDVAMEMDLPVNVHCNQRHHETAREIQRIPLDHICLETDSPARGLHRNVKGQAPETVRDVTTQNAYRLFSRASRKP